MYDDFLNSHKMLNSAWIPIKLTKLSKKCQIFRKKIFLSKKCFREACAVKNDQNFGNKCIFVVVFCFSIALLINSVSLSMTLLAEIYLFNTEKIRILQNKNFSGRKNIRTMLKINQNLLSMRF